MGRGSPMPTPTLSVQPSGTSGIILPEPTKSWAGVTANVATGQDSKAMPPLSSERPSLPPSRGPPALEQELLPPKQYAPQVMQYPMPPPPQQRQFFEPKKQFPKSKYMSSSDIRFVVSKVTAPCESNDPYADDFYALQYSIKKNAKLREEAIMEKKVPPPVLYVPLPTWKDTKERLR